MNRTRKPDRPRQKEKEWASLHDLELLGDQDPRTNEAVFTIGRPLLDLYVSGRLAFKRNSINLKTVISRFEEMGAELGEVWPYISGSIDGQSAKTVVVALIGNHLNREERTIAKYLQAIQSQRKTSTFARRRRGVNCNLKQGSSKERFLK